MLLLSKKNPRQTFRRSYYNTLKQYGIKSSEKALDEVYKYLRTNAKLTDKMIDKTLKIIEDRYLTNLKKIKKTIGKLQEKYYISQRYNYSGYR